MTLADPPDGPPTTDVQALRAELANLATGVRRADELSRRVIRAADERARQLQAKVEELEAENLSRAFEITQLEAENTSLHELIEAKDPEFARVVRERDMALRELRNAHKVIEDLLSRQKLPEGATTDAAAPATSLQVQSRDAHTMHPKREISETVHSDSSSTVRPGRSVANTRVTSPITLPATPYEAGVTDEQQDQAPNALLETNVSSLDSIFSPMKPRTSKAKESTWYLEFRKRPATSELAIGPIPFDVLASELELDDDTITRIGTMDDMSGSDTRIVTQDDLAFVYRPVILEGTPGTYLIGWGGPSMVRNVRGWAKKQGELHMFLYPSIENSGWFYMGIQVVSYAAVESVWAKLSKEVGRPFRCLEVGTLGIHIWGNVDAIGQDKKMLMVELESRNPGMDTSQFKRDVREGRLVQCCIELTNTGKKAESMDFLREIGLLPGDGRVA